ncbi:unnamed protein product [Adineta steineri]|uniref:Uncharacterized protein n=1 Tax=Adineta steineri TaxID=433720 RepID=A0A819DQP9_9BILA|nr:unnamed protein product [Adineta steineri]CAF3835374.1 unnamed protein product [Adineta steineri]
MLEYTDSVKDKDEYIISDDQVIDEIKPSLKRKLSEDDNDDDQNELNIVKKTKKLSITHDKHNYNGPMHTSFVMLVNNQVPTIQMNIRK